MFTTDIKHTVLLGKSGVRWNDSRFGAPTPAPTETPEVVLTKKLQAIKDDTTKTDKDSEYAKVIAKVIAEAFPNDFKKQLQAVEANKGAGKVLDGEAIGVRIELMKFVKVSNTAQYNEMMKELERIIAIDSHFQEKDRAEALKKQLEAAKVSFEQGVAATKAVIETQTMNLSREKYFADKNVSWSGLLSMIKQAKTGSVTTDKGALDALMTKFDKRGWDASRDDTQDNTLLEDLQKAGYLRFSGSAGSLEYGYKVVAGLREIDKDWTKYEKVINGTEALDATKFTVPKAADFLEWKDNNSVVANYLADVSGDGILSQTNQVSRMGFLGIFGREDMNKKPLSELGAAKLLQDVLTKEGDAFWTKLGVTKPSDSAQLELARRALFLRVALADGNPDALRDPSLADKITNRQIKEQTKQLEANNKVRLEAVKKALSEWNKELPPELLDQAGKSFLTAVDVGGLLIGTGVSLEELARNTKIDGDNPKAFTILSGGMKWEKQLSQNLQGHLGAGVGAGVDSAGGFFAGAGVDGGIKLIMQDNGKLSVAKGNQTLELNVGVGTSLLGFTPVGTVELAYRWNDVISALQSSDANMRNFLKGLFKTDTSTNITLAKTFDAIKDTEVKALVGDADPYGAQDIKMAMSIIDAQLKRNDLQPTEKVVAVQNFIENFARYNEIRNYQTKQGFQLAGVGFGVLAGPAVLAPFVRLIGQNIQAGYRVDAEKTQSVVRTKADIQLSPAELTKVPDDTVTAELLKKRGATITADGRGIDVSKAKFANISIIGTADKIDRLYTDDQSQVIGYQPKSKDERLVSIVQTSRDMNGTETYTLLLTTVPAEQRTGIDKIDKTGTTLAEKPLTDAENKVLQGLISVGSLRDTLKGDKMTLRQKYHILERANNKDVTLEEIKGYIKKMSKDTELRAALGSSINDTIFNDLLASETAAFPKAFLGTILALTSGGNVSRKLGLRIDAQKNPTTLAEVNKYLETPGLMEAELDAINKEYGPTGMTKDNLLTLMRFWRDNLQSPVKAGKIPANMYAESAYAKQNQNGTAALPPEARIAGEVQKYTNEIIRKTLIAKLEVPKNLADAGFTKADYMTLLETGEVKVTKAGIEKTYKATKSELHFARSAVTDKRTCFNAVFAITVPTEITSSWTENKVKNIDPKAAGLGIATDTLMTDATKAAETGFGLTGKNRRKSKDKFGSTDDEDDGDPTPPGEDEV